MSKLSALDALAEIAERQDGFVTAGQAAEAEIDDSALARMVRQGILKRDQRGLYRLRPYPSSEQAELWRAVLAPGVQRVNGITAVLCDGTALSLYDVSTINPNRVDVALPRAARLRRALPKGLRIHRRDYEPDEVNRVAGLPVTTLFRTLVDLIAAERELQFVDEALTAAPKRGLITSSEASSLLHLRGVGPRVISYLRL